MANSEHSGEVPGSNGADPFRDPATSSEYSSVSDDESSIDATRDREPGEPRPMHIEGPRGPRRQISSSNLRNQQQRQHVPSENEIDPDAILPIPLAGDPPREEEANDISQEHEDSISAFSQLVTRRAIPEPLDRSPKTIKAGKRKITITKWIFIIILIAMK
jgi:hypothetical protein